MTMYLGSSIPAETTENFAREILDYESKLRDRLDARNLLSIRNVGSSVLKDTVRRVEGAGGNDYIPAKITAKGAAPETTGIKKREVDYAMYYISVGFTMNQKDLGADPSLWQKDIDWCVKSIHRREDYMLFNGDTTINMDSLSTFAETNPNGYIVASGASGSNANNVGAWAGTDSDIDIYKDVVIEGISRLGDDYTPWKLVAPRSVAKYLKSKDDLRHSYADDICGEFGASPGDNSWIWETNYAPANKAFILGKDPDGMEFVISEEIAVDTDFSKLPGKNYYVEIGEWVTIEKHDPECIVEIATN